MATAKLSPKFQKACQDIKTLEKSPSNDELLEIYCLFKTGRGEDFSKVSRPWPTDPFGQAKYDAWAKFDRSMAPAVAQQKYVDLTDQLISMKGVKK